MNAAGSGRVPVWSTVGQAYGLLWRHRLLHAKAIWPPIVFLVTAEVCYRKIFHGGDTPDKIWSTLGEAPWYWIAGLALCWLAGLKFLLSFSISWRRHLALGEKFDPFFFKRPFWKYLLLLVKSYVLLAIGILPMLIALQLPYFIILLVWATLTNSTVSSMENINRWPIPYTLIYFRVGLAILLFAELCLLVRFLLLFTSQALGGDLKWRRCFQLMRGNVLRYLGVWLLAMTPILAFNEALGLAVKALGLDVSTLPVALFEGVFRQAALFVHFSLGASIGLMFYKRLVKGEPQAQSHI